LLALPAIPSDDELLSLDAGFVPPETPLGYALPPEPSPIKILLQPEPKELDSLETNGFRRKALV
jgi:hypothetical protein